MKYLNQKENRVSKNNKLKIKMKNNLRKLK